MEVMDAEYVYTLPRLLGALSKWATSSDASL